MNNPAVSIIVRSYNRMHALCELLEALLQQDHDSFEVVVIEQSTEFKHADKDHLLQLGEDERVNVCFFEPLGGPKARNEGVKRARGEILIFIDDDDLPVSDQWIRQHEEAYEDPKLVGFTGRHVLQAGEDYPYISWLRWFVRRRCMSYSLLKIPSTFARFDEDITDVGWLHGTNSSIRKSWTLKAGLWDTTVTNQDEHSLAFKLHPHLKDGYRLDFRKEPPLIRRKDIHGGMGKRRFSLKREFQNQIHLIHRVILKYNKHLRWFYPLYLLYAVYMSFKRLFKN